MSTANDGQPQCPFFFGLDERRIGRTGGGLGFPLDATEFFCVCQNEVHVLETVSHLLQTQIPKDFLSLMELVEAGMDGYSYLIKRQHLSRHLSTIIQRHSHAIVDLPPSVNCHCHAPYINHCRLTRFC